MFVIEEVFIEDKNVTKVLIALSGLIIKMSTPRPVVNAMMVPAKKGKAATIQQEVPETSAKDRFLIEIKKLPHQSIIDTASLKEIILKVGGQPSGSTYYTRAMIESKLAKRRGRGHFIINSNN